MGGFVAKRNIYISEGSGIPSLIGEVWFGCKKHTYLIMAEEELVDEVSQELKEDVSAEVRMFFTCLTLSVLFFFVFILRSRRCFTVGFC